MESDSESEEFFDAQDVTPQNIPSVPSSPRNLGKEVKANENSHQWKVDEAPAVVDDVDQLFKITSNENFPKVGEKEINREENEKRYQKFKELRKKIETEEDEVINNSPSGSQTSSVDGIHASIGPKIYHPFRVLDYDSTSVQSGISLGRVGRILSGGDTFSVNETSELNSSNSETNCVTTSDDAPDHQDASEDSNPNSETLSAIFQEPDVVASTKQEKPGLFPVPPPRHKRRSKLMGSDLSLPATPSLVVRSKHLSTDLSQAIDNLTKELENSLDLNSAVKGDYFVKPQDDNVLKASPSSLEAGSPEDDVPKNLTDVSKECEPSSDPKPEPELDLTDKEILESVILTNLDTGEKLPLSAAEEKLPQCINPLSLHIMRLTAEYVSNFSLEKESDEDEGSQFPVLKRKSSIGSIASETGKSKNQTKAKIKRFLGRTVEKTVNTAKYLAHEVKEHSHRHKEEAIDSEEVSSADVGQSIKVKMSSTHKGTCEFDNLQFVQDLSGEHTGPVWTMKFSACGRLLATAGQDQNLRIWVLKESYTFFLDMRQRYSADVKASPTPSQESVQSHHSSEDYMQTSISSDTDDYRAPFMPRPFCMYTGHTADLLDVSWSKNYFILSSSMDKTVRLWHISRKECLCCFQHIDFVTAIAFHPKDDRYFISGSLDGKLRFWNIPDKKVASWNELDGQTQLITSANFCQDGKIAAVGSYDGRCIFYSKDQLKYYTQIDVRSTRGKNSKGSKISGIEPMPGENKILVTTNDSRIRLYDLRDLSLSCKYKGNVNYSSQIKASFSHDGKYIISGSENQFFYIWKTYYDFPKLSSARRDRNDYWEGIKAHNASVISAIFSPNPHIIFKQIENERLKVETTGSTAVSDVPMGYVIVTADYNGSIKVFLNKAKPKHSSLPASAMA